MNDLPGGWRAITLQDAVRGHEPIERALHNIGIRSSDRSDLATRARRDLDDAITAYQAGDIGTALATATDLAEEIQRARRPGRGAAA